MELPASNDYIVRSGTLGRASEFMAGAGCAWQGGVRIIEIASA